MPPRVLTFFPHNPYPPRSGAHQRALAMFAALRSLGYDLTIASADIASETRWTDEASRWLAEAFGARLAVYRAGRNDHRYRHYLRRAYEWLGRQPPVTSSLNTPPGMRSWFSQLAAADPPAVVLMSYAVWDGLVTRSMRRQAVTVVDTLDLISLNERMRQAIRPYMPALPLGAGPVDPRLLDDAFFDRLRLDAEPHEYRACSRYAHCLTVTASEAQRVAAHAPRTRISVVPITYPAQPVTTDYSGPALFATGSNAFNAQGYLYFVERVLPRVLPRVPDFALHVSGGLGQIIAPRAGVVARGFVEPLTQLYQEAAFAVCPVLGKTGQQVKIVEAMAHGLPVVATRAAAEGSPLTHAVNGLVAQTDVEMADYIERLWRDRALCRRLGQQAREVIATDYSPARLAERLGAVLPHAGTS